MHSAADAQCCGMNEQRLRVRGQISWTCSSCKSRKTKANSLISEQLLYNEMRPLSCWWAGKVCGSCPVHVTGFMQEPLSHRVTLIWQKWFYIRKSWHVQVYRMSRVQAVDLLPHKSDWGTTSCASHTWTGQRTIPGGDEHHWEETTEVNK